MISAKFIRHSWITSDEKNVNKPLRDVRHRAQKWNVGLERRKERETFCGRLRKRTPFLRLRAQLHRVRVFALNYTRMWAKRTSAFADVLFCILCSWVRKSRDSSLSRFVRATFQVAYGKVRTVIVSKRFFSHPYFCANMVTNLILIRFPFSSVLWSWPKSSLYLCNVQPA